MRCVQSRRPVLMLNGLWADEVTLSVQRHVSETSLFSSSFLLSHSLMREYRLECRFISDTYNALVEVWSGLRGKNLVSLGSGNLCPYCGAYNCAGSVRCYACDGETERFPFLSVKKSPFLCSSASLDDARFGDYIILDMEFVAYGNISWEISYIDGDVSLGVLGTLPNHYSLYPSLNLCDFCGTIVEGNRSCPNCGGQRFPWSELIKMDRKCLYCGEKVVGGIVCQSCGASIAGTAIKSVLGEQSWLKNALTV